MIALTAICKETYLPGGSLQTTHVMHSDWTRRERDIYNVTIQNVTGRSKSGICKIVRLLPAYARIYNIVINNVIDTSPDGLNGGGVFVLGEPDGNYGKNLPGSMKDIIISNCIANTSSPIINIEGYLEDSVISNIVNKRKDGCVIRVTRENGMKNVSVNNTVTCGETV